MRLDARLRALLADAEAAELLRAPAVYAGDGTAVSTGGRTLLSFASNDYLGLACSPPLRRALAEGAERVAGGGSSRVVAGTGPGHREAERRLAELVGLPDARLFASAYSANLGLVGSLFGPDDLVLSDSLNHASLIDGCRLSRARVRVYPHGDLDQLATLLERERGTARVAAVITETVFSMDGDAADVGALRALADRFEAALVVDEAHALGVVGAAGLCARAGVIPDVLVGGLGKAFGLAGGFVAGSADLGRAIDNFSRTFVFSTAILPAIAHAVPCAVDLVRAADGPRERLRAHAATLRAAAHRAGLVTLGGPPGAIVPVVIGAPDAAMRASAELRARGFLVPAMRPPTVPAGTSRLRITPTALHAEGDIDGLARAIAAVTAHQDAASTATSPTTRSAIP